jgi:creatinine amidohydrolase
MRVSIVALVMAVAVSAGMAQQNAAPTRSLGDLNWIEVGRLVPDSVRTVLLPVGTLEPHGVVNNGADNVVPESLATRLAPRVGALVAPTVKYGVTTTLGGYPGTFGISPETFQAYVYEVMKGLAASRFHHIIVLNGHGPNGPPLRRAAERVWLETGTRILVTEWWSLTADLVREIYGSQGGHAGNNETGAVLAVRPDLVHPDLYTGPEMTTPRTEGWTAYPFPSSILLYAPGEGYPDFDPDKARRYFEGTVDRLTDIVRDVIAKWDSLNW